jgi:hypothetical protein
MNKKSFIFLMFSFYLNLYISSAQEPIPGDKITPSLVSIVDKAGSIFNYHYVLTNKGGAEQSIWDFELHLAPEITILSISSPYMWPGSTLNEHGDLMINWNTYTNYYIQPGQSLNGYNISAISVPGIVPFYAEGWVDQPDSMAGSAEDSIPGYTGLTPYGPGVVGKTIGPIVILTPFVILNFLDTLANYTSQALSLSWIKDQILTNKYLTYFSSARSKLVQRDSVGTRNVLLQVLHDVDIDSASTLTSEAYALLRFNTEYLVNNLPQTQAAPFFAAKLVSSNGLKLATGSLQYYEGSWKDATNNQDGTFSINSTAKTLSLRMTYEYGTQAKSNVSISNDTIVFQTVNAQIQLQNSQGVLIDTGTVQYYAGAWRILGTTINGVATKELLPGTYSFRMTYTYASKDKQQDIGTNATVVFQTVNASVQLQNSQGSLIDQGAVQYYSGAWRDLGPTTNGIANKELLPNNYSFRMSYAYASKDKQQDIGANPTVVFQTVNAAVQLQNSQGTLIDQGTVLYYSGAWRDFGSTTNGVANKELLPNNYSFRMTYAYASKDKQQDLNTNPTVVFQTVNASVQLQNSQSVLIDQGVVQYYSGAWREFGGTINGVVSKELLPNNYTFRMMYAYSSKDKQQDISSNPTVIFQTVKAQVQLVNSQGNLIDQGTVQYYSGAWRPVGITTNGIATKELLPNSYSFRMTYEYVSLDKSQDISTNNTVNFATVLCTIRVKDSQNQPLNNALASYYSGAWRQIGNTLNGEVTKELLPVNLTFRINYNNKSQDKAQNLSTNNIVEIVIP